MVLSKKVDDLYNRGDYNGAEKKSKETKTWIIVSVALSIAAGIIIILLGIASGW